MNISDKKIFVLGPNPAWQKTMFFKQLQLGEVNRASKLESFTSGKGTNFCRAAMKVNANPLLFQFAGGYTGELIIDGLNKEGIPHATVKTKTETRTCNTCLCEATGTMTELIEPSDPVTPQEVEQFIENITFQLDECSGLAFCGTTPPGAEKLYEKAADKAARNQIPLLVDSWQNVESVLNSGQCILKVNADELRAITGMKKVEQAIKAAIRKYPKLTATAVTDGPGKAYYCDGKKLWQYTLPALEQVISPLGAGDTSSAVFFNEYLSGKDPHLAFAAGLAAASASCLTAVCAEFTVENANIIRNCIAISESNI